MKYLSWSDELKVTIRVFKSTVSQAWPDHIQIFTLILEAQAYGIMSSQERSYSI